MIGENGILEELDLVGVPYLGGPDALKTYIDAAIVGFDHHINYYKIRCIHTIMYGPKRGFAVAHVTDAQEWSGDGFIVGAIKRYTTHSGWKANPSYD
mmetsp:Transcript_19755/g.27115  ORF Transcript_19755/g.27115 Transcript_19755/m.27115 type:complete len:97 (+) Transcript_19755:207-497(+)